MSIRTAAALVVAVAGQPPLLAGQPTHIGLGSAVSLVAFAGSHFRDITAGPEVAGFLHVTRHALELRAGAALGRHGNPCCNDPHSRSATSVGRPALHRLSLFAAARYHHRTTAHVTPYLGGRVGYMRFDTSATHSAWELSALGGGSVHVVPAVTIEFGTVIGFGYATHRPQFGFHRSPGLGGIFAATTCLAVTLPTP